MGSCIERTSENPRSESTSCQLTALGSTSGSGYSPSKGVVRSPLYQIARHFRHVCQYRLPTPLLFYSHQLVARLRLTLVGHQKDIDGMVVAVLPSADFPPVR